MKKIYQRAMAVALAGTTLLGAGLWHKHHRISPAPSKQVTKNAEALPTGVSEATMADIRSSLEKQEYHISYDERKKKLQSPNRRNNIRAYYEPGKLTVQTRVDTTGEGFKMELVNEGVFADGKLLYTPEAHAKAEHHENKVQISHNAFTEEFINNEDGVRQNFIIENAPEGTRQLQVKMTAKGLKVAQGSGNELRFYSEALSGDTRNELVYSDLQCWDANKKPLSANLAYVDSRIQISVDVAGATYPVTIDPIIANGTPQNANKVLEINQTSMWLGWSVSSAGDVNGDGYSDVVVGAPKYDLGEENEGGAFVYKGGPFVLTAIAVTFQSNQKDAQMGYSVASAGDFNGDGFSDVLVGVPYYDEDAVDQGLAKLYLGSDKFFTDPITSYSFGTDSNGGLTGISVATAGDVNGDGFSDVLIGTSQDSNGQSKEGTVAVCRGSANGNLYANYSTLEINQANAMFGYSLAPAGDVDADGFSDIIVGARWYTNGQGQEGEGAAFIYRGGSNGLQGNPTIIEGNQYNAALGNKVSSAGDVNGDGLNDIIVGAPGKVNGLNIGAAFVILGAGKNANPGIPVEFYAGGNSGFGAAVSGAGDINRDGYDDIIIGAPNGSKANTPNSGVVYIYLGSASGINLQNVTNVSSGLANTHIGNSLSSEDTNGDGYSDIIVGANQASIGQNGEGAVYIWRGSASGIATDAVFNNLLQLDQADAAMGISVAGAGDVNGDGYGDIVVGSDKYDNGQNDEGRATVFYGSSVGCSSASKTDLEVNYAGAYFGRSVGGSTDVNADGYDDIIVGAPFYTNGSSNEGGVWVFYGSPDGVNVTSIFSTESNQLLAHMGASVSGGGDLNGDGYGDLIIGAQEYQENKASDLGGSFVFQGSPDGVITSQPSFKIGAVNYGELMGCSVSGAGDINADGYSDIVIGSPFYNWCGGSLVYYGGQNLNLNNNLRLYNTDLSTPINHTQFPQTNFGAGLFAKSFTGRNKGKLVWETKPTGQGFSKGSNNRISNSTQSTASQNAYSNLGTTGFELKNVIDKQGPGTKVRVRVKYDPVLALTGQSYGPWRYLPAYLMGNGTAPVPEEKGGNLSETIEKKAIRLEEGKASEIAKIYPNPVSSRLNIDLKDKDQVQSLRILTATGSVMYQSNELRSFVDVSNLPEGAYFLIITKTDGSLTTRQILIRR